MTETPGEYEPRDSGDEQPQPIYTDHRRPVPALVLPGGMDRLHAIIAGLMAEKAALQAERDAACAERDGWRAEAAIRQGWAPLAAPAYRFAALARAFAPFLPLDQQAAIIAGLIAEQEGAKE